MKRWHPKTETTPQEEFLLKRLRRTRKLFAFLRLHRHELFDEAFQAELEGVLPVVMRELVWPFAITREPQGNPLGASHDATAVRRSNHPA